MSSEVLELPMREMDAVAPSPAADVGAEFPERVLLARLRRKEPAAFELLVKTHKDRVFDFCVRMVGDREEAFDLTQEIFVSVHLHLDKFREDAKLSTWIFRIAKNHCLNRLKYLGRRGHHKTDELSDVSEQELSFHQPHPNPQEALLGKEQSTRVQRAIAQLGEEQRVLVILRDIEGLSYEEIVQITEQPEGTVKSRLHRARAALAVILGQMKEERS